MAERVESVESRIGRLERECRTLRRSLVALSALLVAACAASALGPKDEVVRAARFEVVGPEGDLRAVLDGDLDGRGGPGLRLGTWDAGDNAYALIQVGRAPDAKSGRSTSFSLLQLESAGPDPKVFAAMATEREAGHWLTNDHRSIESWVEAGRSRTVYTTSDDEVEAAPRVVDEDEEGHPRIGIEVTGERTSIVGRDRSGEVLFQKP